MVIRPYGLRDLGGVKRELDDPIKATGHENLYLPVLVPASVLAQEGALVEGFAPGVAVVSQGAARSWRSRSRCVPHPKR
jgi:prolyl-tRNA synthetase